jgi:SAM-dependent methyltransferase
MIHCNACNSNNLEKLEYRGDLTKNKLKRAIRGYIFLTIRYFLFFRHILGPLYPPKFFQAVFVPKSLIRCKECGFGTISPMPSELELDLFYSKFYAPVDEFDAPSEEPLPNITGHQSYEGKNRAEYVLTGLNDSNPITCLDFGAGSGYLSKYIHEARPAMRMFASDVEVKAQRMEKLGFFEKVFRMGTLPDQEFDLVVASGVWEHLRDAQSSLSMLWSMVAPGGHLFLDVPNSNDSYFEIDNRSDLPHTLYFTPKSARVFASNLKPRPFSIQIDTGGRLWYENWNFNCFKNMDNFLETGENGSDLRIMLQKPK